MQPNELKAVLEKTNEVAAYPAHIETNLDRVFGIPGRHRGRPVCPHDLIRGVVIENGAKWIERRPVSSCGAEDYDIPHRNGVLVEFDVADFNHEYYYGEQRAFAKNGKKNPYPHTELVGKDKVRMVIARKAIFSDWASYALIQAAREKEAENHERKRLALREPQAAIMGLTLEELETRYINSNTRDEPEVYLNADWKEVPKRKANGDVIYEDYTTPDGWQGSHRSIDHEVGVIQITIDQANKILSLLTPAQKKKLKS